MTVPTGLISAADCLGGEGGMTGNVGGRSGGLVVRGGCTIGVPGGVTTRTDGFTNVTTSAWLACSSAVANACTLAKRPFGSLASAVITTCSTSGKIVGTFSRNGGGGVMVCWTATSL